MLYLLDTKHLPFVGKGRRKVMSLTTGKGARDLTQEITAAAPGIDKLDGNKQSMDSDDTSMNAQTTTSDCSSINTASDGGSLPICSFTSFMVSKGYALIRRTLKAVPRKSERMQSRKMQHRFSQAYSPTKASASNESTGPVRSVRPSMGHDLLTKDKIHLNITEDDIPAAVPFGHPTKRTVHVPDGDDGDDSTPCKTSRCPRRCTHDHSVHDHALSSTARETRKAENDQIVDSEGEEELGSLKVSCFHGCSTSKGEPKCTDGRLANNVEEGTGIRKASCPSQNQAGATYTDVRVAPYTPFPLPAVVDSARLPAMPIEHPGSSTESVAFDSPLAVCQVDESHAASSSSPILSLPFIPSTPLHDLYPATDGTNLLAINSISSLTSMLPTPSVCSSTPFTYPPSTYQPSYGAALNSYPLAFPSLSEQVPFAEQPVSTFSGPSLIVNTYDGFTSGPFCSEPFTFDSLGISSGYASFVTNGPVRANEGPLPQPQWISQSDRIDVEMADAETVVEPTASMMEQCFAKPSTELNASRSFHHFSPADVTATTAIHYACAYEAPAAITAFSGVSTALSAVGPSSEEFSMMIIEPSYSQPAFDSTTRHFPTSAGPSGIQSGLGHSSRRCSSIIDAHPAAFLAPILEQPTELSRSRSTNPFSGPSEMPSADQHTHKITTREREIQGTSWQADHLHAILEDEEYTQHASPVDVNVHKHVTSQPIPAPSTVIHPETVVQTVAQTVAQPVGHVNDTVAPVRRQPQYIAPSAASIPGKGLGGKETQPDDDAKTEPDDDAKTEPDDDAKTEPDDGINEKDVNAEVLAHAILDIPLPPAVVASVQLLGQRKRRNSCCSEGITRMRAKRRQVDAEENKEDGKGGTRVQRTRFNHLSRPSPYGSMPRRNKGHVKRHENSDSLSGLHSQADIQSGETSQASGVEPGDTSLSRSPFNPSIRNSSKLHGLDMTPAPDVQHNSTIPISSRPRLRDDDSHYDASDELHKKEGTVRRTRFIKSCVEKTRESAQPLPPPANPIPDRKRPPTLRRAAGYGSAGRQHRAYHPTNGGVQVRTGKLDVMRRARLATSSSALRHAHPPRVVSDTLDKDPLYGFTFAKAAF
ncbi:hypothetical protein DEU56DRAFT_980868 [Suillus clintonianus]|uniref:uncharacterized protein n=1 Tax=Suillus clintonianus TaxID=1904413 RepID=UPI001B85BF77|nr:uncharacterized protein DEU56DRAFT_980868 [Suillus clintonianus]KAG2136708.1 hypothetical protein DEU56DRAFT_980868 [Suillus clintonianus]